MYCYTEKTIPFGWDTKGNIKKISAFETLRVIEESEKYCLVKKLGKGQRRQFLIRRSDLVF